MTHLIDVTAGDADFVTARVTERNGKSLTTTTWQVGLGGYTEPDRPTAWTAADLVETVTDSEVLVSLLIDSAGQIGTGRYLWVLPTDAPTHRAYRVGTDSIDVI